MASQRSSNWTCFVSSWSSSFHIINYMFQPEEPFRDFEMFHIEEVDAAVLLT